MFKGLAWAGQGRPCVKVASLQQFNQCSAVVVLVLMFVLEVALCQACTIARKPGVAAAPSKRSQCSVDCFCSSHQGIPRMLVRFS